MKSMRDFIARLKKSDSCAESRPNGLEPGTIPYRKLNEEQSGPALLFEKVKGYNSPVITSVCTTTRDWP